MPRWLSVFVFGVVVVLVGACGDDGGRTNSTSGTGEGRPGVDGLWLLATLEVDDAAIAAEGPLFVEIDGREIQGNTTCNDFGGELGGEFVKTAKACIADDGQTFDPMEVERAMIEAVRSGPQREGAQLVFMSGEARLVYDPVPDPSPTDLFSVIDDAERAVGADEIFLDPEAGSHPDYSRLVRLDHPSTPARFYLGVDAGLVCFVASTDDASATICRLPRYAVRKAQAYDLANSRGPVGVRYAFIPDAFTDAVAQRSDLGELVNNVLLVDADAPPGRHVFADAAGQEFVVDLSR